ncbi:hypothetical protein GWO43_31070 [candidate division KSB1 bacterium]|nr:hypothetical protein [candidate division KSB1 bacterium]NIT75224.1 hypothetical protein [candidate division KSB1 bacterium]NIV97286.1 hypothetical protein [candidate division KSB1 bacterium]NIX74904.1 hypothetical protein [candidate division KSB1 bacterium]
MNTKKKRIKKIRLSGHARDNLRSRGTSKTEIIEAIQSSEWAPAERGRLEWRKEFEFQKEWNGKFYATKQVRPIFVEEKNEIVVVTVYVYYY